MEHRKAKRVIVDRLPVSAAQLRRWRKQIAEELPDLIRRNQLAIDASKERTFSGAIRRAVNAFPLHPKRIAERVGVSWARLDDFLTGEKTLPSDVIDRLVKVLKLKLPTTKPKRRAKAG